MNCFKACSAVAFCLLSGCMVGPKYNKPSMETPAAYKELNGWKVAQPKDDALRGKWWAIFNDPLLNTLEDKVNVSNQNVAAAAASYLAARALVKEAQSQLFPTVTLSPSVTGSKAGSTPTVASYSFPIGASWQPDLFGSIQNTIRSAAYGAQSSAADLENTRLTMQAELAEDYFQLRGQDSLKRLLDATVVAYQEALDLTKAQYDTGVGSAEAVAEAETQLEAAQAQAAAVAIQRAQFEHAIAMLIGKPASTFSIPIEPLKTIPPAIPAGIPSELLERRPDIAGAERLVAQANAQIGIAKAAYFPTVTLSAAVGFASSSFGNWFTWPSSFFSVGSAVAQTLFDAGLRDATVLQYKAQYEQTVANYRQTVLTAFQQVEDNLVSLRVLVVEIQHQDAAVQSAAKTLTMEMDRYELGIDPYLSVINAQTSLLSNQEMAVSLRIQQMTACVSLIQTVGGGWTAGQLPSPEQVGAVH